MRVVSSVLAIFLIIYIAAGCQQPTISETAANVTIEPESESMSDESVSNKQEDEQPEQGKTSRADRLFNKASDIFKKATDSSNENAATSKEWILDKIQEATDSGGAIGEDAAQWATDMFDSLKEKGLTGAGDAREWLTEDIRNMNAYKYKLVKVSFDDLEALEDQLNHLGQLKWECFHVAEHGGETIMFFKKERRSILQNLQVKDMMKLIPLMGEQGN